MVELFILVVIVLLVCAVGQPPPPSRRGGHPMHKAYYRTRDGGADYRFGFVERSDGTWRIYILDQPGYGHRSTGTYATHRLSDGGPHQYICWTGTIRSLADAKQVAAVWADRTQGYIRTGTF
jgi:hypothetical protein